ncbi:hypothetical protein NP233_g5325 [Leucocoprinus birnbaumii]|uniref:Nephrocystin 3-like N-terminal domain-containing protein n=1 Tax=Leucocoprinus birnbaumii TaxID=56174 RepID=A0AAD5YUP8_9AGAR|nr:hypothetical protein NP233_g5325 [Leucocoprinus birnbaumii]
MAVASAPPVKVLENAQNVVLNNPIFVDSSSYMNIHDNHAKRDGLRDLLAHSMRGAFHDSSDRWPPPQCHYDSRQELRSKITAWGTGASVEIHEPVLWMYGPFGVGKSAIAQSSADALAERKKLIGSLFFSRSNGLNNPNHVFTSIAAQLALIFPPFANILDRKVRENPTLLTAARPIQFEELIVKPLHQLQSQLTSIEGSVVILDGLDEIDGVDAQCDIIRIVAKSVREQTTPFRWFIASRPEPHIQRAMQTVEFSSLLHHLEIPLSPIDDHEILAFFTQELDRIGNEHDLSSSWCGEAEIATLVKLAHGLWAYVAAVIRFIASSNSLGPIAQLRLVLSLAEGPGQKMRTNPLAAIDQFYDLIMRQIPSEVVLTARKLLLINEIYPLSNSFGRNNDPDDFALANALGLSRDEFHVACGFLQSVLHLQTIHRRLSGVLAGGGLVVRFYHASFMEYLSDSERSSEFCIYNSECFEELLREIIQRVHEVHSRGAATSRATREAPSSVIQPMVLVAALSEAQDVKPSFFTGPREKQGHLLDFPRQRDGVYIKVAPLICIERETEQYR